MDDGEGANVSVQAKKKSIINERHTRTYVPYLELVHLLELELLGVLEHGHCRKIFHASMEAQRMIEHDVSPHACLSTFFRG